jgi:hypothetical protein
LGQLQDDPFCICNDGKAAFLFQVFGDIQRGSAGIHKNGVPITYHGSRNFADCIFTLDIDALPYFNGSLHIDVISKDSTAMGSDYQSLIFHNPQVPADRLLGYIK